MYRSTSDAGYRGWLVWREATLARALLIALLLANYQHAETVSAFKKGTTTLKSLQILAFTLPAFAFGISVASADQDDRAKKTASNKASKEVQAAKEAESDKARPADNTGKNKRDRDDKKVTADQQSNKKSDVEITAEIRRGITDIKDLSVNAQNVKIITTDGKVTLRGPVKSNAEKVAVEQKAIQVAGKANVTCEIEVAK